MARVLVFAFVAFAFGAAPALAATDIETCKSGTVREAISACDAVIRDGQGIDIRWAYLRRGDLNFARNAFDNAADDYDAALLLQPDDVATLINACRARAIANVRLDAALADCQRAIQRDGFNASAHNVRGLVYYRMGRYGDALKDYEMSLHARPNHAGTLFMRGMTKIKLGKTEDGEADIDDAKRLDMRIEMQLAAYGIRR